MAIKFVLVEIVLVESVLVGDPLYKFSPYSKVEFPANKVRVRLLMSVS